MINNTAETVGSLSRTSCLGFSGEKALLKYLKGKKVLDLGSGAGFFAKGAYQELGDETTIVSFNPRLTTKRFRDFHEGFNKLGNKKVIERYKSTAVAGDWNELPFGEESFDTIFATGSFLFYDNYDDKVMTALIKLLKKGTGELRIEINTSTGLAEAKRAVVVAKQHGCLAEITPTINVEGKPDHFLFVKRL